VIVRDFHLISSIVLPDKADAVSIIDFDAMLSGAITLQCFAGLPVERANRQERLPLQAGANLRRATT
jgi:hypothetical protein